MGLFGGRSLFGKKKPVSYQELKQMDWNTPDPDGVARVFSSELWDDPDIGSFLREVGMTPDDPRNIRKTMDDIRADFARANERLEQRIGDLNAEFRKLYGHCQVGRFLLIDAPIWDGEHGAFLSAQLELCPYDEWNIMLLATDVETVLRCPVLPHVGPEPSLTAAMEKKIATLHARYEHGLELFGLTATLQQGGITREKWDDIQKHILEELMAFVENARRVFSADLESFAANVRSGKTNLSA